MRGSRQVAPSEIGIGGALFYSRIHASVCFSGAPKSSQQPFRGGFVDSDDNILNDDFLANAIPHRRQSAM